MTLIRSLDSKRFVELVAELERAPMAQRAADVLRPVAKHITKLHEDGRTYNEIWKLAREAGMDVAYTTFLRAVEQLENQSLQPAALMRRRRRISGLRPVIPAVPESIPEPAPAKNTSRGNAAVGARAALLGRSLKDLQTERLQKKP